MSYVTAVLYPVLGVVLNYLGARAEVTRRLWRTYKRWPWFDAFMGCPACSGAWQTAAVAVLFGQWQGWSFAALPGNTWYTPIVAGLVGIFTTPPLMWLLQESLIHTSLGTEEGGDEKTER